MNRTSVRTRDASSVPVLARSETEGAAVAPARMRAAQRNACVCVAPVEIATVSPATQFPAAFRPSRISRSCNQ